MNQGIPDFLKSGERARLIPAIADTNREQRALSILLASITATHDLAKLLLGELGQRIGNRTWIDAYTEVTFQACPQGVRNRPDGLIEINTGRKVWRALIEAKIGNSGIDADQIQDYLAIARANEIDAVLTISNQFVARPTHSPVELPKKRPKSVELYHWSWMRVLTQAKLLISEDEIESADQRYLLGEAIRFFDSDKSGVSGFDQMNPEWKDLVLKVQSGTVPKRDAPEIENTVAAWHQEQRDIGLALSRGLGRQIRIKLKKAHRDDPMVRLREDCEKLVNERQLHCTFDIPDAASDLDVIVDLRTRTVTCSMSLEAPEDKKKTSSRVNWIVRQLKDTDDSDVMIKARWPSRAGDTIEALSTLRDNPMALQTDNQKLAPTRLDAILVRDLAGKFTGRRTFIEHLEHVVPVFYRQVGQHLRAWVPPPPKPKKTGPSDFTDDDLDSTGDGSEIPGDQGDLASSDTQHSDREKDRF